MKSPTPDTPDDLILEGSDLPEPTHVRPVKPVARPNLPTTGVNTRELAKILARQAREAAAAQGAQPQLQDAPVSAAPVIPGAIAAESAVRAAIPSAPPPTFGAPPALAPAAFDADASRARLAAPDVPSTLPEAPQGTATPIATSRLANAPMPAPAAAAPPAAPPPVAPAGSALARAPAPPRRSMTAAEALEVARALEAAKASAQTAPPTPAPPSRAPAAVARVETTVTPPPAPAVVASPPATAPANTRGSSAAETTRPRPRKPADGLPAGVPGRAMAAAPPPRKPMSAAEALVAAREAEAAVVTPHVTHAPPTTPSTPTRQTTAAPTGPVRAAASSVKAAQALLGVLMPELPLYVAAATSGANAAMRPLWKSHRARLVAAREVEQAFAAAAVASALGAAPESLCFALVVLEDRELLTVLDLEARALVAVFPEARVWGVSWD
jgi:hypothetical protein